jgi:hypothetical protein
MKSNDMKKGTSLDRIARRMASQAGVAWSELADYPGYVKNLWRDEAHRMILDIAPDAVVQPGQVHWDGSVGDAIVINPLPLS